MGESSRKQIREEFDVEGYLFYDKFKPINMIAKITLAYKANVGVVKRAEF